MTSVTSRPIPSAASTTRRSGPRRAVEAVAFVGVWVAAGYLLPLSSNGYLLLGIPLTVAFQLLVARRPLRELIAAGTGRFRLDGPAVALAVALAIVPGCYALRAVTQADRATATTGWYLAATAGAVLAAFAIRSGTFQSMVRYAVVPIAIGAGGMAVVYGLAHAVTRTPLPVADAVQALPTYLLLYFPATFLLEEVSFRGALDAHMHQDGDERGWRSAVFVSALWGLWHLPVTHALPLPLQLAELVVVHVVLGVPLSMAWRRSRNLAAPALAHAVNDAVRNAVMLGL